MSSTDAVKHVLNELLKSYSKLLDILQREKTSLMEFNAEEIDSISKEKDTMVLRIRLLEDERKRLIRKLTNELTQSGTVTEGTELTLEVLWKLTGMDEFREMRLKLKSMLQSIREMNECNRLLIDRSLSYISSNTNFFNSYGIAQDPGSRGVFLAREV